MTASSQISQSSEPCEVSFYHLTQGDLDKSVAKLLEKVYEANHRSVLCVKTEDDITHFNKLLWTFSSLAFLPHGSAQDGDPTQQPVYLTTTPEAPNNATILATVNAETIVDTGLFKRCLDIFNGHDNDAVTKARQRWTQFKDAGHTLTYWKQDEAGRWYQEASSSPSSS